MRSRDFKNEAREALSGNWLRAIFAWFIAGLFGATGVTVEYSTSVDSIPQGDGGVTAFLTNAVGQGESNVGGLDIKTILISSVFSFIVALIIFAIQSAVSVGYAKFNINMLEGDKPRVIELFAHFKKAGTAMWASILVFVRVFIGFLLFIIPGVIAAYQYSMVNYVIADNPDMTAREALAESKRIMKGYKWRFFCLSMSFIGWAFVVILTAGIASAYVGPFMQASVAALYCEARDNA